MLGIEGYGSDVESDNEQHPTTSASESTTTTATLTSATPSTSASSSSKLTLPPPKSTVTSTTTNGTNRRPKKINIGLPSLPTSSQDEDPDETDSMQPPVKKSRIECPSGKGTSSLLSMLPAPKNRDPVTSVQHERMLGGGAGTRHVFKTFSTLASAGASATTTVMSPASTTLDGDERESGLSFLPVSLVKGQANVSVEDDGKWLDRPKASSSSSSSSSARVQAVPPTDFFSLASSSSRSTPPTTHTIQSSVLKSSAPTLPTYKPPSPTPQDPYPGYYQLPSGTWAAHEPTYYATYTKKWQKEYDDYVRALEQGKIRGFEDMDESRVGDVDAGVEREKAMREVREREERKAVTGDKGAPPMPKMKITAAKQSGIARSRHQLSTLLTEAYMNREALEEKIAEGRRNRKEAGNKYGF